MDDCTKNISVQISNVLKSFQTFDNLETRLCQDVCSIENTMRNIDWNQTTYCKILCYITKVIEFVININKEIASLMEESPIQELQELEPIAIQDSNANISPSSETQQSGDMTTTTGETSDGINVIIDSEQIYQEVYLNNGYRNYASSLPEDVHENSVPNDEVNNLDNYHTNYASSLPQDVHENSVPNDELNNLDNDHTNYASSLPQDVHENSVPNDEVNNLDFQAREFVPRLTIQKSRAPNVGDHFTMCHVVSPSEFYICLCDEYFQAAGQMQHDLQFVYQWHPSLKTTKSKLEVKEEIGSYCIAYTSSENRWFRGQVLDWFEAVPSTYIHLQDVDSGKKLFLSYGSLFPLQPVFTEIPARAIKCALINFYAPESVKENRSLAWPHETLINFNKWTGVDVGITKYFMVTYTPASASETVRLDFSDGYTNNGSSIIDYLAYYHLGVVINN